LGAPESSAGDEDATVKWACYFLGKKVLRGRVEAGPGARRRWCSACGGLPKHLVSGPAMAGRRSPSPLGRSSIGTGRDDRPGSLRVAGNLCSAAGTSRIAGRSGCASGANVSSCRREPLARTECSIAAGGRVRPWSAPHEDFVRRRFTSDAPNRFCSPASPTTPQGAGKRTVQR
jgi:hypothetical protein